MSKKNKITLDEDDLSYRTSTREVYLKDGVIYKKALNKCGLDYNINEMHIYSTESKNKPTDQILPISIKEVDGYDDGLVVKSDYVAPDDFSRGTFKNSAEFFGIKNMSLAVKYIDYLYFTSDDNLRNRMTSEFLRKRSFTSHLFKVTLDYPPQNKNVFNEFMKFVIEYNLEPVEVIANSVAINENGVDRFRIIDYGLTQENFLKNVCKLLVKSDNKILHADLFFRDFNDEFVVTDQRNPYLYDIDDFNIDTNIITDMMNKIHNQNHNNNIIVYDINDERYTYGTYM